MNVLGIDLGTANSAAFFSDGRGKPKTIIAREGASDLGKAFPSYVEFDQAGEKLYVGKMAYDDYASGTTNTVVWGSKRLIGISFREARKELRHLDYPTAEKIGDHSVIIPVGARQYAPSDIATMILDKIKKDAMDPRVNTIGRLEKVVVSHPAYFESDRREATLRAVKQSFRDILPEDTIVPVSEPVAAALGYGLELPPGASVVLCVIDLGAGTLDIVTAVLTKNKDGKIEMMPDPAKGNASFGGIDIDGLLIDSIIQENQFVEFERFRRSDVVQDEVAGRLHQQLKRLRSGVEKAKIRLSNPKISQKDVDVEYGDRTEVVTLSRDELEQLMDAPLSRERVDEFLGYSLNAEEMERVQQVLKVFHPGETRLLPSLLDVLRLTIINSLGNYKTSDIEHVLLVGGPMHMPCIRKAIKQVFAANPNVVQEIERIDKEGFPVNPMECVARGASLYVYDKPPDDILDFYYALVTAEEEGEDGRTNVYYDDESWLKMLDKVPQQKFAPREETQWTPEIKAVPLTLLQGKADTAVPGGNRILWKKSAVYPFHPVYDDDRKANFTVALDVNKNKIVNLFVEDKNSGERYPFAGASELVGEVLEPKEYEVIPESERPDFKLTVGRLKGLDGFLDYLSLRGIAWLMPVQTHSSEDERNRAKIRELVSLLPLHKNNLAPVLKKYESYPDDHVVTDPAERSIYNQAGRTVRALHPLLLPHEITYEKIEAARNSAQALFPYVSQLREKTGGDSHLREQMLTQSNDLERALSSLPHLKPGERTSNKDDITSWEHVTNLTVVLKSTINTLRKSLGMPPVS